MNYPTYLTLFISILFFSGSENTVLEDFNKVIQIKGEVSQIKSADLGEVVDLMVLDSVLIVSEYNREKLFKSFNIHSGRLIDNFINRGRGPNEMNSSYLLNKYDINSFNIYDRTKHEMISFNLNDIIKKDYRFKNKFKLDVSELVPFKVFKQSNTIYIISGIFKKGMYCLYNSEENTYSTFLDFPEEKKHKKENNQVKALANQGEIARKPDGSEFVFCSDRGFFDICLTDGNTIKLKKRKIYYLSEYKNENNNPTKLNSSKYAFHSTECTENNIYMIYSGRSLEQAGSEYYSGNKILVYDWEGNPVVCYKTDRYLNRMTLDEKNMIIYAYTINPESAQPEIVSYRLPDH